MTKSQVQRTGSNAQKGHSLKLVKSEVSAQAHHFSGPTMTRMPQNIYCALLMLLCLELLVPVEGETWADSGTLEVGT